MVVFRIALLLTLCCVLLPAPASARRSATTIETKGIRAATGSYIATSGCCVKGITFRLVGAWVSTVNGDFALARVAAIERNGKPGPRANVVLVNTRSGKWIPIAFGSARLACGVAHRIRADLRLLACR